MGGSSWLSARATISRASSKTSHWETFIAHVTIRIGEDLIESVITRRSAEELDLKKGDRVSAVVKATEVMIAK